MNEERRETFKNLLIKSDEYYRYLNKFEVLNIEIEDNYEYEYEYDA